MTEIAEGIAILLEFMEKDAEQKCEYQPKNTSWKCKLDGDSGSLRQNLWDHCGVPEPEQITSVSQLGSRAWPSQAHHLIPWQQLKKHEVTQWLSANPPKGEKVLYADNDYSVDHGNNGKFMPYSSALAEWGSASSKEKERLSRKVMREAGIQLHQGPHSFKGYGVGEAGYKTRVAEYLARIHGNSVSHYTPPECQDCKGKKQAGLVPPRRNVVRYMDKASERLEIDINTGRIFVSRRAAGFAADGGILY